MAEDLRVTSALENGVVVLTVNYGAELMLAQAAHKKLSDEMVNAYKAEEDKTNEVTTNSCVVVIQADTAGSPLVRALFELYKTVYAGGGQVSCVGFPADYIDSLTTLGLTGLPGFNLGSNKEQAIKKLTSNNQ